MNSITVFVTLAFVCTHIYNSTGIFNGKLAVEGQYPFAVKILYYFVDRSNRTGVYQSVFKYTCTGSIVNKDFVLTSAGCFQHLIDYYNKTDNTDFTLQLSSYDPIFLRAGIIAGRVEDAPGFQERYGNDLIIHPDYRNQSTMFDVDMALITLKTPWDLNADPTQVAAAPRWAKRIQELDWLKCFVVGFGYTTWNEYNDDQYLKEFPELIKGNILRYYKSRVGRERYCKYLRKNLGRLGSVKGEVFDDFYACATPINATAKQGTCFGDIGAPLICDGIVTGVMSQHRSKRPTCGVRGAQDNSAFVLFTSVGADEVITFIRKHVSDFPELVEVPPGDPFDD